jgi:hypothetical protein
MLRLELGGREDSKVKVYSCRHIYIHVCFYTYICMYVCINLYPYACMLICMYECVYMSTNSNIELRGGEDSNVMVCLCQHVYIYVCSFIFSHMYIYIYVCM